MEIFVFKREAVSFGCKKYTQYFTSIAMNQAEALSNLNRRGVDITGLQLASSSPADPAELSAAQMRLHNRF